ncbi:hypothetical protein SporoP8_13595 [Sporosarcina ureae]|uniref:hypothetical protein n=1 Tax=Sporosarcina TaxID=1569 RepID=UPI000A15D9EF|nr:MULTISPECIES: hypothetical protein [Sporosarcina]ARJ39821.1 hypothetical protein SporoP8_13595 [Sporosarcina ureae]PIC82063.1 hypothetical protein CSV73_14635 [Sporosarcina sp. P1]
MSSRPWTGALISAKYTEIRQSEPFAVHLARAAPSRKRPPAGAAIPSYSPRPLTLELEPEPEPELELELQQVLRHQ